jgi:hypothetical protein
MKKNKEKNVEKHIIEFCNLLNQLTITRATILCEEFACVFIRRLNAKFTSFINNGKIIRVGTMQVIGLLFEKK